MEQITIKEIAKLCGVGVSTVSRAINNHPDINDETKTMIMNTIREYNYVPNNSARNLKRSVSKAIAVLVKGVSNPYFGQMIQVIEREIMKQKYSFVLQQVEEEEDEIEVAIQLEKEKRLKGIIFLGGRKFHSEDRLAQMTVPFVICTVDVSIPDTMTGCAVVSIDDEKASYQMTDYLCKLGHRRIALMTAPQNDVSIGKSRSAGYRRALQDNGIAYDEELVLPMKEDLQAYTIQSGYEMAQELIRSGKEFTCIYAISDTMAIGACRALRDAGREVPKDCAVAGFDGLDIAQYYYPSITTICQPREEMAEETVKLLFGLIRRQDVKRRVIFDAALREGESTQNEYH